MSIGEILRVENLKALYGRAPALWEVGLTLKSGDGLGLIGRNGAGKSTLLRSIAGVHSGRLSGRVVLAGSDVLGESAFHIARRGLSLVREGAPVFGGMSILDNMKLGARLAQRRGINPRELDEVWEVFPMLKPMSSAKAGLLSGGQRQMLAMATALVSRPTILLLDEPSAGLAPEASGMCFQALADMRSGGLSVLIAEQNVGWLAGVVTHTVEIRDGRTIAEADVL